MIVMRLINANLLSESIWDNVSAIYEDARCAKEDCLAEIEAAPTVDAAPVVRCKDCLFLESGENECESWEWCKALHREMPPHAFCSLGERKGDSDDEAD